MLKFDKDTHKIENIGILEKEEARAYVDFLEAEKDRHRKDIERAKAMWQIKLAYFPQGDVYDKAYKKFWQSAIRRHKKDIEDIDVLVETLKGFYGI